MELQDFGHPHALMFNEQHIDQSEAPHNCSRCGEVMSGPSFSCLECGFYLHKECAEAPSQINHPLHRNHALRLLPKAGYWSESFICNFCGEKGMNFDYHCSHCHLDLHIKCALVTYKFADKKVEELKRIACEEPKNGNEELGSAKCLGCWEPLLDSIYYSLDSRLNLHKRCAEIPFQINHPYHRKHPLILQFNGEIFPCKICQNIEQKGFFYCCSLCNFSIHVACSSQPPSVIEERAHHQHPFTMFLRQFPFTCDACGIEEENVFPYMCLNCNLLVHKKCITLPRFIKFIWHEHSISHIYSFQSMEFENWECVLCREKVKTQYGSYHCAKSDCHFVVHVNCVMKRKNWYYVIEADEKLGDNSTLLPDLSMNSFIIIERNTDGEVIKIKHFSHDHILMLNDKIENDDKYCDGCTLIISDSFYHCSQCNFFLHKICAEFPKGKHYWDHLCQQPLILTSGTIFKCSYCRYVCNGFAYTCDKCGELCLRCATPDTITCQGHEHPLSFYVEYEGQCNACGEETVGAYKCKWCKFALHGTCVSFPPTVQHKCDEHLLKLTYYDKNIYSKSHFCDICEENRNPNHWYYYCANCDTSAHVKCILGRYPFVKPGGLYGNEDHAHPLTLVKKMYHYPECFKCGEPCLDLAAECVDSGCDYIAHWDCIAPPEVREWFSSM